MTVYVKVDSNGDVVEFPYRDVDMRQPLPEDVKVVNTIAQRPFAKWYEGLWYDRVERQGDEYFLYYTKGLKTYTSEDEKKQALKTLVSTAKDKLQEKLSQELIDVNQYQQNLSILNSINVDDPSTYDLYHSVVL